MISVIWKRVFFFFKQKTAYEISLGLVGSEMCIRDRAAHVRFSWVSLHGAKSRHCFV